MSGFNCEFNAPQFFDFEGLQGGAASGGGGGADEDGEQREDAAQEDYFGQEIDEY